MKTASNKHSANKTPDIGDSLLKSFERHLKAERKDPDTVHHYVGASQQFMDYCRDEHMPVITEVTREHVELWLGLLHETYRPYTVRNRYVGLRIFFKWLMEEDEIQRNPMDRIKPPSLEESRKDVASPADILKVIAMLEKAKRWRDLVVVAILYDTGMRASELADLRTEDVNLDTGIVFIPKTKANRVRAVRLSPKAIRYVDRYLRKERLDPAYLLNGIRGKMTRSGIYQVVRESFEQAGVKGTIGAHDLRHTSASHAALDGLLSQADAMKLYGWSDSAMWELYTAQAREQAALKAHERASPLERLTKKP